jgi:Na+/melibiose symporter-like transporter
MLKLALVVLFGGRVINSDEAQTLDAVMAGGLLVVAVAIFVWPPWRLWWLKVVLVLIGLAVALVAGYGAFMTRYGDH